MEEYWDSVVAIMPMSMAVYGEVRYRDRVDDLSDETFETHKKRMDKVLKELATFKVKELSDASRIHFDAFEWMVQHERKTMDYDARFLNFSTIGGWHDGFAQIVLVVPNKTEQDYRDLLKRMRGFAKYTEQNLALMEKGIASGYTQPCEVLDGYEASISGYISDNPQQSMYYIPFADLPVSIATETSQEIQAEAKQVIKMVINPNYQKYADFFHNTYRPACRVEVALSSLPRGRELYNHYLRFYTSLDTDAESIYALGLKEVARIRAEMNEVMKEAGYAGSFSDFLKFLRTDPQFYAKDERSYLHYIAWVTKSIDGKLPQFFARLPSNPYGISVIPKQTAAKATTAYYQPGSVDGTRAGQYFVNTYKLLSRPLYEIPALSLHESVPGHHLQFAFQGENVEMPQWRRIYYFHAYGEGWGLYSEHLGEEMGIYTTPYEHFGRLIYEMWRAVRLVVDPGMHAKGWSRRQAIDYMLANTGLTEQNVVAEVDRYITYPGQATAYKHGELKIRELRKRANDALGKKFDLRQFHVEVLEGGSLPLTVLEGKIDRWINAQQR